MKIAIALLLLLMASVRGAQTKLGTQSTVRIGYVGKIYATCQVAHDLTLRNCQLTKGHTLTEVLQFVLEDSSASTCGGVLNASKSVAEPVLQCGEYQHVEHWPGQCGPPNCDPDKGFCPTECALVPPDKCADDLHVVTEREWQAMMGRIKALETAQRGQK